MRWRDGADMVPVNVNFTDERGIEEHYDSQFISYWIIITHFCSDEAQKFALYLPGQGHQT